ncbi:CYCB1-2, partial [Linum perenne]
GKQAAIPHSILSLVSSSYTLKSEDSTKREKKPKRAESRTMASRPVVPQEVREQQKKTMAAGGGGAEKKSRRALGDIGNLAVAPDEIQGKIQQQIARPVTRSFRAQLLANAQAAAAVDNHKVGLFSSTQRNPYFPKHICAPAALKKEAQKKPKPKPPVEVEVINISPDSEEAIKSNKKCQERSMKKKNKLPTLTSTFTTASKSAAHKPKQDKIFNIDAPDADNHLAVTEYVEELYNFYKLAENESRPICYMEKQPEMNSRMRAILVDWLIDVHQKFELSHETLYLAINIIDRFLSVKSVPRKELQLVGISATLMASKYEEIWPPEVNELVLISDRAYCSQQILVMEKTILASLEWTLTVPTQYVFLVRFLKAATGSGPVDKEMEFMAHFMSELGLMDYECSVMFCPSMVAAAAVYAARSGLNRAPAWNGVMEFYTGYKEAEVVECGRALVGLQCKVKESKLQTVVRKYSSSSKGAVAMVPPVKSLVLG